jgi:ferric-dicitrate binding protein FerR (iron transport regulator)
MIYLSISRLSGIALSRLIGVVCSILLVGGMVCCKGGGSQASPMDTATAAPAEKHATDTGVLVLSTLPDGSKVWKRPHTEVRPAKGFNEGNRDVTVDGEAFFIIAAHGGKPFIIHTRNLIVTVQSSAARLHVDAFASSPGEQVDLLEGQLKVIKSYHSSTDNEPEVLSAGDMVMINRDIDLMEKEKLDPAEQKAVERKFPMAAQGAPHN